MDRAERRFRARRIAEERFHDHFAIFQSWFDRLRAQGKPIPLVPVGTYRKRGAWSCHHCTKHRNGSPHYGWGACYQGNGVRPAVKARHDARRVIKWELDLG